MPKFRLVALALLLASCGSAPVANRTLPLPDAATAILLLRLGPNTYPFFTSNTLVTTQGNLALSQYTQAGVIQTGSPTALFDISSPMAAGFRAVKIPPGTYAIRDLWLYPLWFMCLNKSSLAFEAKAGTITFLGDLGTMAYVNRLRDFALANPPQHNHPHLSQRLRQIDATSFAPTASDTAQAQAFATAQLGPNTTVVPAAFTQASWPTQDNWAGVDECATKPGG